MILTDMHAHRGAINQQAHNAHTHTYPKHMRTRELRKHTSVSHQVPIHLVCMKRRTTTSTRQHVKASHTPPLVHADAPKRPHVNMPEATRRQKTHTSFSHQVPVHLLCMNITRQMEPICIATHLAMQERVRLTLHRGHPNLKHTSVSVRSTPPVHHACVPSRRHVGSVRYTYTCREWSGCACVIGIKL